MSNLQWEHYRDQATKTGDLTEDPRRGDWLFFDSGRAQTDRLARVTRVAKRWVHARIYYKGGWWGVERPFTERPGKRTR